MKIILYKFIENNKLNNKTVNKNQDDTVGFVLHLQVESAK